MDTSVLVSIITATSSLLLASLTYFFTRRQQIIADWRQEKVHHYTNLLGSLSDLAVDGTDKDDANSRFARYVNTICLVAPTNVIEAVMAFHNEVKFSNPDKSVERHDKLLSELMVAIREDIGLSRKQSKTGLQFHLIGAKAPPGIRRGNS